MLALLLLGSLFIKTFRQILSNLLLLLHPRTLNHSLDSRECAATNDQDDADSSVKRNRLAENDQADEQG